jgi:hypothetical protein
MKFIRVFLWGLVAAMTLQGFLHADEYGSAVSFFGGVSMTLSIWKENLWSQVRALVPGSPVSKDDNMPRALVVAALQESARHPGLHTLPTLRRALADHRRAWDVFREEEVQWMLGHADLIGALRAEGHTLWRPIWAEYGLLEQNRNALIARQCQFAIGSNCAALRTALGQANTNLAAAHYKMTVWERLLSMDSTLTLVEWWNITGPVSQQKMLRDRAGEFEAALSTLHNVTAPHDARVRFLRGNTTAIAVGLGNPSCPWTRRILQSLLLRDLWGTCLSHIHRRESRVQELIVATGIQELYNTHERLLAAAMRSVTAAEAPIIQNWFDLIANHAWWLSEDVPAIVRRCVGQTLGECRRIGPTEITSLISQFDERSRIVKDWTRCLFIGMWNAMPAVCLLFVVELVVLLIPTRHVHTFVTGNGEDLSRLLEAGPFTKRGRRPRSLSQGGEQRRLK